MIAPACSGKKKSVVWGHFEKVKIGEGDTSKTKTICNYCQKSYNADSKSCGTSNLLEIGRASCRERVLVAV